MADKSLLAELLLSPSDVRKKEEQERLARGQMMAQNFMAGNQLGGVGGMLAAFGAQQAAMTENDIANAFRRAGTGLGADMRSVGERKAATQQEQMKMVQGADNLTRLKAVKKRLEDNNASPAIMQQLNKRIEAEKEAVSKRAKDKFDRAQAEATAARADESLELQRETLQVRKDELARQGVKPTEIEDVVRVIDGKEVTGTLLIDPVTKEEQFFRTSDTSSTATTPGGVTGELAEQLSKLTADITAARESGADPSVIKGLEAKSRALQAAMNIGDKIQPVLTKSFEAKAQAVTMAARADDVIKYIDANEASYTSGAEETFRAGLTGVLGTQGERDVINTVINQVRIAEVIQNLPPGVASDKDVALVLEGALPANASASAMRAYMRGIKKIAEAKAAREEAFADYINDPVNLKDPAGFPSFYKAKQEKARRQDLIDNWGVDKAQAKALSKNSKAYGEFILRASEEREAANPINALDNQAAALGITIDDTQ